MRFKLLNQLIDFNSLKAIYKCTFSTDSLIHIAKIIFSIFEMHLASKLIITTLIEEILLNKKIRIKVCRTKF